jgi:hypothetical protein
VLIVVKGEAIKVRFGYYARDDRPLADAARREPTSRIGYVLPIDAGPMTVRLGGAVGVATDGETVAVAEASFPMPWAAESYARSGPVRRVGLGSRAWWRARCKGTWIGVVG